MKHFITAFVVASVLGQAVSSQLQILAAASSPPSCSLDCLETLVPEFCGSLANTTCVCTDKTLAAELTPCALSACNVTESFRLEKYQADLCGVPNDKSRLNQQLNCYYTLPIFATLFVFARIYIRSTMEEMGPDDWMMLAAWVFYIADTASGSLMIVNKFGLHTYELTTKQMENSLMYFYIAELWYILTITLTKLSLLLFFRRIFPQRGFMISTWILLAYTSISNFAVLMGLTFQCIPFHGSWTNWEYAVAPVKCINTYALVYFAAGNSIFQDIVILALPIPLLLKLNLGWRKKANLLVMFSVGTFVVLCSVLRLPSLIKLKTSTDPSWDQAPIGVWTNLEESVGLICACLPACRALAGYLFPSLSVNASNIDGTPPAYSSSRGTKGKLGGTDDRSFIALHDRTNNLNFSRETGFEGAQKDHDDEFTRANSNDSNLAINPETKAPYGASNEIYAETGAESIKGDGIVMTREVDQSVSRSRLDR